MKKWKKIIYYITWHTYLQVDNFNYKLILTEQVYF